MKENDDKPGSKLEELIALINMASPAERDIIFEQIDLEMRQREEAEQDELIRLRLSN